MNKIVFEILMFLLSISIAFILLYLQVGIIFFVVSIFLAGFLITYLKKKFYKK